MQKLGAQPFFFEGNREGVLLVHGYTGAPGEMRLLGEYLNRFGFTVMGVLLPGHGTKPEDLNNKLFSDWFGEVEKGVTHLKSICEKVYVVGLSMGGLLTIKAAAELNIDKAVIISAPIYVQDKRQPFYPFLKHFIKYLPKAQKHYDVPDEYLAHYHVMPVKPIGEIFDFINKCQKGFIRKIRIPCLVMQSKKEHTVRPDSAQYIFDRLSSKRKKLIWYEKSGHILTLDKEHNDVFDKIRRFLTE